MTGGVRKSLEDEIDEAGEATRQAILARFDAVGVNGNTIADLMAGMLNGEIKTATGRTIECSERTVAFAVERYLDLTAAIPKRQSKMRIESDQRVLRLSVGDGSLGSVVDLDKLRALPPDKRQAALKLLGEVMTQPGDMKSVAALPPGKASEEQTEG